MALRDLHRIWKIQLKLGYQNYFCLASKMKTFTSDLHSVGKLVTLSPEQFQDSFWSDHEKWFPQACSC